MKSEPTHSFDILESGLTKWYMWEGRIQPGINVVIKCNDCGEEGSKEACNYNGECGVDGEMICACNTGYFGANCEYEVPCSELVCECLNFRCCRLHIINAEMICPHNHLQSTIIQLKRMRTLSLQWLVARMISYSSMESLST